MPSRNTTSVDTPANHLYEYAVVRFVPSLERGEFMNIGLVMMCKKSGWIRADIRIDRNRLHTFAPNSDLSNIAQQSESFRLIANGARSGGPISTLDAHERFRWLTAVRSASLQTSRPHPGFCNDLDTEFDRLFDRLV